ncbi:MAG: hypothetical protein QOJ98_3264 [Acidobacteriota bacterium]|nr:hypothetical protein [Acidobacteriota bacterium]
MRKLLFICGVLFTIFLAAPAEACQACHEYFHPQSWVWCTECVPSRCGYFECQIEDWGSDICITEGDACFEYGGDCPDEPQSIAPGSGETHLAEKWQLKKVNVQRNPAPAPIRSR